MADRSGYIGRAPGDSSIVISRQTFNPTGVQTDFTFSSGYIPGYLDVYLNGVRLIEANDYTATDTSVVGLTSAAQNGDVLEMVAYKAFNIAVVSEALSDFIVGNDLNVSGDVTVTGDHTTTGDVSGRNFTGVAATFTGNVTVGGVLTYEDVTSVDSLGILTARTGVHVLAGGVEIGNPSIASTLTAAGGATFSAAVQGTSFSGTDGSFTILNGGANNAFHVDGGAPASSLTLTNTGVTIASQFSSGNVVLTGVSTFSNVVVGGATTELVVTGDARVTGILTVGTSSVTINGDTGKITGVSNTQLAGISSSISDTATNVFVYDTSKDSDGGSWRKRTQNTSWYNEAASATRGTRKEFPSVAVIVCGTDGSNGYVHIYDGDDPDLPMWMEFSGNAAALYTTPTSVVAMNGMIFVGTPTYGLPRYDFIGDTIGRYRAGSFQGYKSPDRSIGGRDTAAASFIDGPPFDTAPLVNDNINDVAMTVLPNAPIDDTTGLPIPTIVLATEGGTSIIKDNGTVADFSGFAPVTTVHIDADNVIGTSNSGSPSHDFIFKTHIPGGDEAFTDGITAGSKNYYMNSSSGTIPLLRDLDMSDSTYDSKDDVVYRGGNAGFDIIRAGVNFSQTHSNPAIAYIASDYNTGYMPGDIKGAFLSDTYTGADFGPEIVTGGNFSDASQWTLGAGWSINGSGQAVHTGGASYIEQAGTFTGGRYYQMTADLISGLAGHFGMTNRNEPGVAQPHDQSTLVDVYCAGNDGKIVAMWQQRSGINLNTINLYSNNNVTIDNVSIKEISRFYYDRSVNNKPLALFGSLTRSAVATGANLVGYSGFNASNHLLQPNNSDLQFGTGDLHMIFWHKKTDNSANEVLFQALDSTTGANGAALAMQHLSGNYYAYTIGGAGGPGGTNDFLTGAFVTDGNWHCVAAVRSNGTLTIYVDGRNVGSGVRNYDVDNTGDLYIGSYSTAGTATAQTSTMALLRIGGSAPSPEQIKKIYEDEKCLFHENAQATLYGSSDAVTALAYDDTTELLHVGTSAGRSEFQGLRRINNTTTAVTTAISASNDLVAEQ